MQHYRLLAGLVIGAVAMTATARIAIAGSVDDYGFDVGDRFPEIVLPSLDDGTPRSIASFRGRKLVLHIWASW